MMDHRMLIADFLAAVAALERERGYEIGGFALNNRTGQWKIIGKEWQMELLDNQLVDNQLVEE